MLRAEGIGHPNKFVHNSENKNIYPYIKVTGCLSDTVLKDLANHWTDMGLLYSEYSQRSLNGL